MRALEAGSKHELALGSAAQSETPHPDMLAANTMNKNYLKTEELTPIEKNPGKVFKSAL